MPLTVVSPSDSAFPLHVFSEGSAGAWMQKQPEPTQAALNAIGFTGALGQAATVAGTDGKPALAVAGYGTPAARKRGRFHLAAAAAKLPKGDYLISSGLSQDVAAQEALGWLLAGYRFDRYRTQTPMGAR